MPNHVEGGADGGWTCIDFGDVIVNVMTPASRDNLQHRRDLEECRAGGLERVVSPKGPTTCWTTRTFDDDDDLADCTRRTRPARDKRRRPLALSAVHRVGRRRAAAHAVSPPVTERPRAIRSRRRRRRQSFKSPTFSPSTKQQGRPAPYMLASSATMAGSASGRGKDGAAPGDTILIWTRGRPRPRASGAPVHKTARARSRR